MRDAKATQPVAMVGLFERIGRFLDDHRLSPEPAHYSFAHAILADPESALAREVARLTEGGVRLKRQDIERLGGRVIDGPPFVRQRAKAQPPATIADDAAQLVVQTQHQVEGFATMMRAMQDETRGFGHDLAKSAAAITRAQTLAEIDEITRITTTMIGRIRDSEVRLARATEETEALREKLAEARDTARRDTLTGLPNRRAFDEAFAARDPADAPHCLALCDIDRFKRVNDEFGHPVGDRVLSAIGEALAKTCDGHIVSRHGGEEFAILLAGCDLASAATLLDAARAEVASRRFRDRDTGKPLGVVTISAGVTAIRPDEKADTAFERADRLLYTAKDTGRDKVCAA